MAQTAKIMLVEDDNNLSEIYQARLTAEGYTIVSAHDGEEALALAAKEKPDLIIADVMMPKISGFEMLDILRNTPNLKETKVIMLTALGQAEDKTRAQTLGADRYLVKSQVTLEDIVKNTHDILSSIGIASPASAAPVAPVPPAAPDPTPTPMTMATPPPDPTTTSMPVASPPPDPSAPVIPQENKSPEAINSQVLNDAVNELLENAPQQQANAPAPTPPPPPEPAPTPVPVATPPPEKDPKGDSAEIAHKKIIRPLSDAPKPPDLNQLLAAEEAKNTVPVEPAITSTDQTGVESTVVAPANTSPPESQPHDVVEPDVSGQSNAAEHGGDDPNNIAL